jgi:hypothetical protein
VRKSAAALEQQGWARFLKDSGVEIVPALHAYARPFGMVQRQAYEKFKTEILAAARVELEIWVGANGTRTFREHCRSRSVIRGHQGREARLHRLHSLPGLVHRQRQDKTAARQPAGGGGYRNRVRSRRGARWWGWVTSSASTSTARRPEQHDEHRRS